MKKNAPTKTQTPTTIPANFPTMGALSGSLGIPLATLKNAKRAGCPAFSASGRVELGAFIRWHFRQPPPPAHDCWKEVATALDEMAARCAAEAAREK